MAPCAVGELSGNRMSRRQPSRASGLNQCFNNALQEQGVARCLNFNNVFSGERPWRWHRQHNCGKIDGFDMQTCRGDTPDVTGHVIHMWPYDVGRIWPTEPNESTRRRPGRRGQCDDGALEVYSQAPLTRRYLRFLKLLGLLLFFCCCRRCNIFV